MYKQALSSLTVLFFMMGFITCLNDILVPYMKEVFQLGYTQASLVQFCFFGAYGLTSIPASNFIDRVGYQKGMVWGFVLAAFGCLLFYPAVSFNRYEVFLGALFILATGIVLLQVAANPFVSILGSKETASARLNMVQAFNSFGTFLAPFFGSYFILSKLTEVGAGPTAVRYPYVGLAAVLVILAVFLGMLKFPSTSKDGKNDHATWAEVLKAPGLFQGMAGIFTYVGAEVAIGSFLVNFVMDRAGIAETEAAHMVAYYWGGAMVGRFVGIYTLNKFKPGNVLSLHSLLAIGLILISINTTGILSIVMMILVGFCNSIMFPTIFTLGIKEMPDRMAHKASGLLATAILGGAIVPLLTGNLADTVGLRLAFLLPAVCYAYIAWFGRSHASSNAAVNTATAH